jgi:hypothetical protein
MYHLSYNEMLFSLNFSNDLIFKIFDRQSLKSLKFQILRFYFNLTSI